VHLDLPWNPARLEQRVGRVDRLGQTRRVHATLLTASHSMESGILARLAERVMRARQVLGGGAFNGFVPERALTRALLRGTMLDESGTETVPPIPPATRWKRRAEAIGRCISRRRRLTAAWQAGSPAARRYLRGPLAIRGEAARAGRIALWTLPVIDGVGTVLERHFLAAWVACGAEPDTEAVGRAVEDIARRRLAQRLSRLERILRTRAHAGAAVERAIGRYLATLQFPEIFQPELFHDRASRAALAGARQREDITRTAGDRLDEWQATGAVSLGRAALVLVTDLRP